MIILNELRFTYCLLELFLIPCFHEKTTRITKNIRLNQFNVIYGCIDDIHICLLIV
ncbi:Hypothetical protein ABZS17G119_01533 [Kosakonia cowanii]